MPDPHGSCHAKLQPRGGPKILLWRANARRKPYCSISCPVGVPRGFMKGAMNKTDFHPPPCAQTGPPHRPTCTQPSKRDPKTPPTRGQAAALPGCGDLAPEFFNVLLSGTPGSSRGGGVVCRFAHRDKKTDPYGPEAAQTRQTQKRSFFQ